MTRQHKINLAALVLWGAVLPGCAPILGIDNQRSSATQSVIVSGAASNLSARAPEEIAKVAASAARLSGDAFLARPGAARVATDALPFLTRTRDGRRFLSLAAPRALARGAPAESCPATGVSAPGAADRSSAVAAALGACLARLEAAGAPEACGCELLAVDDIVTAERSAMAYSTGTAARIRAPALGIDAIMVAEDTGPGETLLRDLAGPVAVLRHLDGGRAELDFVDGPAGVFSGHAEPVGFRRGRLAERVYLEDEGGRRISLLIGFGPDELARSAGGWLVYRSGDRTG